MLSGPLDGLGAEGEADLAPREPTDETRTLANTPSLPKIRSSAVDVAGSWNVAGAIKSNGRFPLVIPLHGLARAGRVRTMDFSEIAGWGREANDIVEIFCVANQGNRPGTLYKYHQIIKSFLKHLFQSSNGRPPSEWSIAEWRQYTNSFILKLKKDRSKDGVTQNRNRYRIVSLMDNLRESQIAPHFMIEGGVKDAKKGKKKGIAAVARLDFDLDQLSEEDRSFIDEIDTHVNISYPEHYLARTRMLQDRLRTLAEDHARRNYERFQWAERVISDPAGFDVDQFLNRHATSLHPLVLREDWLSEPFSEEAAIRVAAKLGPQILSYDGGNAPIYARLHYNSRPAELRNAVFPSPAIWVPFITIFLLDLENEISSVLGMQIDCCQLNEEETAVTVHWKKGRAEPYVDKQATKPPGVGSSLERSSDKKIETFQAVKAVLEMRKRLAKYVVDDAASDLFVVYSTFDDYGASSTLTGEAANYNFQAFRKADPVLALFPFSLDKLRSTALEKVFVESGGNLFKVQRHGNHRDIRTSQDYVRVAAGAFVDDTKARALHELLVCSATRNQKNLQKKLDINEETASRIVAEAMKAGMFGYHLEDGQLDPEAESSEFVQWMLGAEHVLLESAPMAGEIIAFEAHLRAEAKTLRDSPSWNTTWVYLLLYLNAAITEMRPDIRRKGEALAKRHHITYAEVS